MNSHITFLFLLSLLAGIGRPVSGQLIQPTGPAALTLTQANRHLNPDHIAANPGPAADVSPKTVGDKPAARPLLALFGNFRWLKSKRTGQDYVRAKPRERYQPGEPVPPTPGEGQVNILPNGRWLINRLEPGHLNTRTLLVLPGYDVFTIIRP